MLVNCQSPLPAALHWLYIISCPGWCLLWDKEKLTVIQTVIQNTSTQLCSFHIDKEMLLLEWLSDSCTFAHTWLPIEKLLFFVYIWYRNRALREQCVLKARSFSLWRKTEPTLRCHLEESITSWELDLLSVALQRGLTFSWKVHHLTIWRGEGNGF